MAINSISAGSYVQGNQSTQEKQRKTQEKGQEQGLTAAKEPKDSYTFSQKGQDYLTGLENAQAAQLLAMAAGEEDEVQKIIYDHPDLASETAQQSVEEVPAEVAGDQEEGGSLLDLLGEALEDSELPEEAAPVAETEATETPTFTAEDTSMEGDLVVGEEEDEAVEEEGTGESQEETTQNSIHGRVSSLSESDMLKMQMALQANQLYSAEFSSTLFDYMTSGEKNEGVLQELLSYNSSYTSWISSAFTTEYSEPDSDYTSDELSTLLDSLMGSSSEDGEGTGEVEGSGEADSSEDTSVEDTSAEDTSAEDNSAVSEEIVSEIED